MPDYYIKISQRIDQFGSCVLLLKNFKVDLDQLSLPRKFDFDIIPVTPRDRRSRRLPYISCSACVLFVCCIHHRIICIASALRCRHVLKLAFARRWRFSLCLHHLPSDRLACVDRSRPIGFSLPSWPWPPNPSLRRASTTCPCPKLPRTRTGLSLPLGPNHPQTSIKHLCFRAGLF